jgi:hypothetical protein
MRNKNKYHSNKKIMIVIKSRNRKYKMRMVKTDIFVSSRSLIRNCRYSWGYEASFSSTGELDWSFSRIKKGSRMCSCCGNLNNWSSNNK